MRALAPNLTNRSAQKAPSVDESLEGNSPLSRTTRAAGENLAEAVESRLVQADRQRAACRRFGREN